MIRSMTGYGKGEAATDSKKITVEIRSLNSKQLDMAVKMPGFYRPLEYEMRGRAAKVLQRGKVDIFVNVETTSATAASSINDELFAAYFEALRVTTGKIQPSAELDAALVSAVLRFPDVVSNDDTQISKEEQSAVFTAFEGALDHINSFRAQEGHTLIQDLLSRIDSIQQYKSQIIPFEKRRIDTIKERIRESISALKVPVDDNRLEQEMIFYVEKLDITEEKVRLDNHCRYFREVAGDEENAGRKLGFISQEIGREINTLGSKANDSDIQQIVVRMKDELEKIKEQVLNIL